MRLMPAGKAKGVTPNSFVLSPEDIRNLKVIVRASRDCDAISVLRRRLGDQTIVAKPVAHGKSGRIGRARSPAGMEIKENRPHRGRGTGRRATLRLTSPGPPSIGRAYRHSPPSALRGFSILLHNGATGQSTPEIED